MFSDQDNLPLMLIVVNYLIYFFEYRQTVYQQTSVPNVTDSAVRGEHSSRNGSGWKGRRRFHLKKQSFCSSTCTRLTAKPSVSVSNDTHRKTHYTGLMWILLHSKGVMKTGWKSFTKCGDILLYSFFFPLQKSRFIFYAIQEENTVFTEFL